MQPIISIKNLSKSYPGGPALKQISFEINEPSVVSIIGPSGAGKTTLLRCLNWLTIPEEGVMDLPNVHICPGSVSTKSIIEVRKKVGMVFQHFNLWPHKTALENVALSPKIIGKLNSKEAEEQSRSVLIKVGLADKLNHYPATLSGGEQQRVAIARSLVMRPEILLLDEITSALDPELAEEVVAVIRQLARERACTLIVVTHEMDLAREISDQVIFMDKGEIVEQGRPEMIFNLPKQERTRKFLEKTLKR